MATYSIVFDTEKMNTTKPVEVSLDGITYVDGTVIANPPAGVYANLTARLKGSSPEVKVVFANPITVPVS